MHCMVTKEHITMYTIFLFTMTILQFLSGITVYVINKLKPAHHLNASICTYIQRAGMMATFTDVQTDNNPNL